MKSEFVGFLCTAKLYVHTSKKNRMSSALWLFSQAFWNLQLLLKVKSLEIRYVSTDLKDVSWQLVLVPIRVLLKWSVSRVGCYYPLIGTARIISEYIFN